MILFRAFIEKYIQYFLLAAIVLTAIGIRWISADFQVLLDADPWWFYRHAQEIYNNSFQPPKWDLLSYYPPGRPVNYYLGWSYTIATFYAMIHPFLPALSLMKFSGLFTPVFASLSAVPAYFVGRMITNRWGGLVTALLVVISPAFLTVSLAGDADSDSTDVFYTLLAVLTTLYAIKKADKLKFEDFKVFFKSLGIYLPYVIPAILAYWLFATNWNFSWYIYFIFLFFIPLLILFRFLEGKIFLREKGYLSLTYEKIVKSRNVVIPVILIGLLGELISSLTHGWPYNTIPIDEQLRGGLAFLHIGPLQITIFAILFASIGVIAGVAAGRLKGLVIGAAGGTIIAILLLSGISGQTSLVNQSIAELQPIDLLSAQGISRIAEKLGNVPILLGMAGLIGITLFKLFTKKEIKTAEYFTLVWLIISLFLVSAGERFSLLVSIAIATAAGFMIGNFIEFSKHKKKTLISAAYGLIVGGLVLQVYYSMGQADQTAQRFEVSNNWVEALTWLKDNADKDALVVSSWDSGHMIAGFTGLKVHSDGAHCDPASCIPYSHDMRMTDMSRIFTTRDENESLKLLQKYTKLSSQECESVRANFGNIVPADACKGVSNVFVVASADLVTKYNWLSYYGTYDYNSKSGTSRTYVVVPFTRQEENGNLVYGNGKITISHKNNESIPLVNLPDRGIKNKIISQMVSFDKQGNKKALNLNMTENTSDGLVWIEPDGAYAFFMDPEVRDSIFTKMFFFDGRGLQHFQLVYQNIEVKIYKASW